METSRPRKRLEKCSQNQRVRSAVKCIIQNAIQTRLVRESSERNPSPGCPAVGKAVKAVQRKYAKRVVMVPGSWPFWEVRDGWANLLDKLIDDLLKLGWDGHVHQVKEKFGGLRFYIGFGNDAIFDRISKAEDDSFKICEVCGKKALKPRAWSGWWIQTLCRKCGEDDRKSKNRIRGNSLHK